MTDFGDLEPDDVVATEPADPEAVARIIHALRRARDVEAIDWEALTPGQRLVLIAVAAALLDRLRREGSL